MKNNIIKFTAVTAMLLSLVVGSGSVSAQNPASGATAAGAAAQAGAVLAVPAGYTVIPADDSDRSDDQIVQLENLVIRNISGAVPGTIYASRDVGGTCREYLDVSGSAGSRVFPCPAAPNLLYQVSVQSDTILLLKDRTRASIGDFAIGDRINVFGFMDRNTSGVQGLIVRDLDKPSLANDGRYVQLNGLTVVSGPDSDAPPTVLRAAQRGVGPCFSFSNAVSARGIPSACPLGIDISTSAETLTSPGTEFYRPFRQYYDIRVSASTQLLNVSRRLIGLADMQAGDLINVYGRYVSGTRAVEALILRDLSVPRDNSGQASLIVAVTDKNIVCVTTPCGQVDGIRVDAHWLDYEGDDTPTLTASQLTTNGQAVFRSLKPGRYVITAGGEGYASVGQQVVLRSGETGRVNLLVSRSGNSPQDMRVLSPNGGETLKAGSAVSIRWDSGQRTPNAADIFIRSADDGCVRFSNVSGYCPAVMPREYTVARGVGQAASDGTMSYRWTVPNTLEKILLGDGAYYIKVCQSGTSNCDWSDSYFKTISGNMGIAPSISSASPSRGPANTTVTLRGRFAASGNYVYLAGYYIGSQTGRNGISSDGTTLTFIVPEYVGACSYNPYDPPREPVACIAIALQMPVGTHPLHVINANGTSNSVTFEVTPPVVSQ